MLPIGIDMHKTRMAVGFGVLGALTMTRSEVMTLYAIICGPECCHPTMLNVLRCSMPYTACRVIYSKMMSRFRLNKLMLCQAKQVAKALLAFRHLYCPIYWQ